MKKDYIKNARYELISSSCEGLKEVQVIFNYKGQDNKYFIFIKEEKGVNYINKAKKIFAEDVKSGKVDKNLKLKVNSARSGLIIATCVLGAAAIALGGFAVYKVLNDNGGEERHYNPGEKVEVTPEIYGPAKDKCSIKLDRNAVVGEAYHTNIELELKNDENYTLPATLDKVMSNTTILKDEQYNYNFESESKATLDIEAKFVFGPVSIELTVLPVEPSPIVTHDVIFHFNNDTDSGEQTTIVPVEEGASIVRPTWLPTFAGHDFDDWYDQKEDGSIYTFPGTMGTEDVDIYAHWRVTPINYTISYNGVNCKAYRAGVSPTSAKYLTQFTWRADTSDQFNIVLVPDTDYHLPDSITVLFNGQPGVLNTDYEYKKDNKTIAIKKKAEALISLTAIPDTPASTYTFTFSCTHCVAKDDKGQVITSPVEVPIVESEHTLYQKFIFAGTEGFFNPLKSGITIKKGEEEITNYDYITQSGTIYIPIVGDLTITVTGLPQKTLQECTWGEIKEISEAGFAEDYFGEPGTQTKDVTISFYFLETHDVVHQVKIIGYNHDDLANGNGKAGITFQFEQLFTEYNETVVAWDKTDNKNFPGSELCTSISKIFDESEHTDPELLSSMKEVNKPVAVFDNSLNAFTVEDYSTKIFPLSYNEMYNPTTQPTDILVEGSTYDYYIKHSASGDRTKHGAGGRETLMSYWLRSPRTTSDEDKATIVTDEGEFSSLGIGETVVACFVPAFCI